MLLNFESTRENLPLVSCIMPTHNRRAFVPQAIAYFLRQDYPQRELIIVDDGTDPVGDLVLNDGRVRYIRQPRKAALGTKRNIACDLAHGEIIIHWDDDDWMANHRLSYQVACLLENNLDMCGLDRLLFYDVTMQKAWQYLYPKGSMPWVAGGTLCYAKSFWKNNPFPEINVGEDTRFLWSRRPKRLLALEKFDFYVALIHPHNTSKKQTQDKRWHPCRTEEIRRMMGEDWRFYCP